MINDAALENTVGGNFVTWVALKISEAEDFMDDAKEFGSKSLDAAKKTGELIWKKIKR